MKNSDNRHGGAVQLEKEMVATVIVLLDAARLAYQKLLFDV